MSDQRTPIGKWISRYENDLYQRFEEIVSEWEPTPTLPRNEMVNGKFQDVADHPWKLIWKREIPPGSKPCGEIASGPLTSEGGK